MIEKLSIDFSNGFSIITGETGAGKSILLGALGLVLGKRADLTSLKNKDEKCVIEAHFQIANYNLQPFFEANDLDYEAVTILRREILPSGKSRAFINDTPVNLQELQDLSLFLIDVHSQHQTQELSEDAFQFQIIDAVANNFDAIEKYTVILKQYKKDKAASNVLNGQLQSVLKEQDYNAFLLNELQSASLQSGEQAVLEAQFEQLNNVEFIKGNLNAAHGIATEEQYGILHNLNEMRTTLQKNVNFSEQYHSMHERINSVFIEMKDAVEELQRMSEQLIYDPEKLELAQQKLQVIYGLQKKHQVASIDELLLIQSDLEHKVDAISEIESQLQVLENQSRESEIALDNLAATIHQNRIKTVPSLIQKWTDLLAQLGMPNVQFKIEINAVSNYLSNGKDELQFLFSANKGSDFGLLKKSGFGR